MSPICFQTLTVTPSPNSAIETVTMKARVTAIDASQTATAVQITTWLLLVNQPYPSGCCRNCCGYSNL